MIRDFYMPLIALVTIFCQILCGVHIMKTGQERYWLYLIIMLPGIGCAIYAVVVLMPELMGSYKGRQVVKGVQNKIAPTRNLKTLRNQLTLSDNVESRTNLADELVNLKQYAEAITHYKVALSGIHSENPEILLKLAFAEFAEGNYQDCQHTLDYLIKHNPDFRSPEGHLLYARTVEAIGNLTKAEEEYKVLVSYYAGPDARFFYAKFLQSQNRLDEAIEQLQQVQDYVRIAPKYYKNVHKICLSEIRKLLQQLHEQTNTQ